MNMVPGTKFKSFADGDLEVVDVGSFPEMKAKYPEAVAIGLAGMSRQIPESELGRTWILKDDEGNEIGVGSAFMSGWGHLFGGLTTWGLGQGGNPGGTDLPLNQMDTPDYRDQDWNVTLAPSTEGGDGKNIEMDTNLNRRSERFPDQQVRRIQIGRGEPSRRRLRVTTGKPRRGFRPEDR